MREAHMDIWRATNAQMEKAAKLKTDKRITEILRQSGLWADVWCADGSLGTVCDSEIIS